MTFAIFIILFLLFFVAVLNTLPLAGAVSPVFISSLTTLVGTMKAWNFLFPISELFACVAIVVGFEIAVWVWHVLVFILKKIRGGTS